MGLVIAPAFAPVSLAHPNAADFLATHDVLSRALTRDRSLQIATIGNRGVSHSPWGSAS